MSEPVLAIENVQVEFSGFRVIDGFSMNVAPGELRVLIGANGAGKTTLMDTISGKTKATGGSVRLKGRDITNWRDSEIARAGVGRKFQVPSVFRNLSVAENLEVAASHARSMFANLRLRAGKATDDRIEQVLTRVGLQEDRQVMAGNLSHGQMQWLELGMVLIQNPEIILLDEPTAGMTALETRKTADIINRLKGNHTLVVVEHDMTFVRSICETITVMHLGKKLAEGPAEVIERDQAVIEAYLGSGGFGHA